MKLSKILEIFTIEKFVCEQSSEHCEDTFNQEFLRKENHFWFVFKISAFIDADAFRGRY